MDLPRPPRAGEDASLLNFKQPQDQFRAVRSASSLVMRPASYAKGIHMLMQLIAYNSITHRAKQLVYAAMEASGNLIMKGQETGKMEVEESMWRNMLETAATAGKFSEAQVANINRWLQYDWSTIVNSKTKTTAVWSEGAPMRLRMAETVLQHRTSRISLVLENLYDDLNQQAVIRTADCFGIQNLHVVSSKRQKNANNVHVSRSITKNIMPFMTVHHHASTQDCVAALKQSGHEIWATDLSPGATTLDSPDLEVPSKLAVVFGRELDGCSKEILEAADRRVFIPIYGFAESLNLSVAAALVMQNLFIKCPQARGDMTKAERAALRERWYDILGRRSDEQRELFRSFLSNPPPPLTDIRRMEKFIFTKGAPRDNSSIKRSSSSATSSPTPPASPEHPKAESSMPPTKRSKTEEI